MSISTLSLNNSGRASLMRLQVNLKNATTELNESRYADVGTTLGRLTGTAVSYRVQETSVKAQQETNTVIASRLKLAYGVMESVAKAGESLAGSLLSAEKYSDYPELATSALQQMQGALNTSVNGLYVFGGQNAAVAPIKDVDAGIAAAKAKYDTFLAAIGRTSATVSKAEMTGFLSDAGYDVTVSGVTTNHRFMDTVARKAPNAKDTNWSDPATGKWSTASSVNTTAAISSTETIETSVSANEDAFRNVTAAYSMLAAIAGKDLNSEARTVVTRQAASILKTGTDGITALRATVGTRQARVDAANTALKQQQDIVAAAFARLEGVDETEAGMRVTSLKTQLEVSYKVVGQLQQLSILNYL